MPRPAPSACPAGAPGEFREGAELITFRVGRRPEDPTLGSVTSVGSQGGLLLADPDSGGGATVWIDPLLRTRDAAEPRPRPGGPPPAAGPAPPPRPSPAGRTCAPGRR